MIENIFRIIKADRYTKDGCDEIQKAKDNLAEDEKYNIGDISKKTGLQKTANGWVEPKKARAGAGKAELKPGRDYPLLKKEDHVKLAKEVISNTMPGGSEWSAEDIAKEWKLGKADAEEVKKAMSDISAPKSAESKPDVGKQTDAKNAETNYGKVEKKDGKWGVQQKLGKGSQFIEHKDKKDATEALKNYTEGYNTTARSKQNPHSDEARQVKQWNKETEKIKKENRAERRAEHAAQFQNQGKARKDGGSKPNVHGKEYPLDVKINEFVELYKGMDKTDALNDIEVKMAKRAKELRKEKPEVPAYMREDPEFDALGMIQQLLYANKPLTNLQSGDAAPRQLTGDCKIRIRK